MNLNIARLDLVSIRLAVICAEVGSLSAASKRAYVSLSTASHRITALEDALGQQLFERDHTGVRLTDAGQLFLGHGQAILERLQLMSDQLSPQKTGLRFSEARSNPGVDLSSGA